MKRLPLRLLASAAVLSAAAFSPLRAADEAGGEQEVSDLVGKSAPDFTLDLLGGEKFKLSEHRGKDIVVLDFWATWCGPCVYALPIVSAVTGAYKDKGVVFVAMDQAEEEKVINQFLEQKKLDITVGLDRDAKVGRAYDVQGIPTTVIVDKEGKVQAVHVGASPNLKKELEQQLDDLLAGKSLILAKTLSATDLRGMEMVWAAPGRFGGIAADGAKLYALNNRGRCTVVDATGKTVREFAMDGQKGFLRTAKFSPEGERAIVAFDSWGGDVKAYDSEGKELWSYPGGDGVDDVWAASVKGDDIDQAIVGYTGGTGIHVVNGRGKPLWKSGTLNTVWHVCAGDLGGDGAATILATSKKGDLHLFDSDGKRRADMSPGLRANMVRVMPGLKGQAGKIVTGGFSEDGEKLIAMDAQGKKLWELAASSGKGHIDAACPAPGWPWLAVAMRGGRIFVVNTDKGEVVAESIGEASRSELAWMQADGAPLLVVTGRDALHAYRIGK